MVSNSTRILSVAVGCSDSSDGPASSGLETVALWFESTLGRKVVHNMGVDEVKILFQLLLLSVS